MQGCSMVVDDTHNEINGRRYGKGCYERYKGHYLIAFYDKTGEHFIKVFSSVREILAYQGRELTRKNVNLLNIQIYRAINWYDHKTEMLNGRKMTVWLIDEDENEELDIELNDKGGNN